MAEKNKGNNASVEAEQPAEQNPVASSASQPSPAPKIGMPELFTAFHSGFSDTATDAGKAKAYQTFSQYLRQEVSNNPSFANYNIVILYDNSTMIKSDADKIYNAVTKFATTKPILLVLYSRGGEAASAYLIGKLCREYSSDNFVISVPRFAKSAATLICCAANEIHMGSLSELGPIDPQINNLPALGLKNSIEHIAELVRIHPASSDMFAQYLHRALNLINLGYYERVAESAMQYAEKLLNTHPANLPKPARDIALELVYKYKDHGFVIDKAEAETIFGSDIIKMNTEEYELGNQLYQALDLLRSIANVYGHSFYFIGSLDSQASLIKNQEQ